MEMFAKRTRDSEKLLENTFLIFFRKKKITSVRDNVNDAISPVITNNDNEVLTAPFTFDEFKEDTFSMFETRRISTPSFTKAFGICLVWKYLLLLALI
jgi:hypothetical protein